MLCVKTDFSCIHTHDSYCLKYIDYMLTNCMRLDSIQTISYILKLKFTLTSLCLTVKKLLMEQTKISSMSHPLQRNHAVFVTVYCSCCVYIEAMLIHCNQNNNILTNFPSENKYKYIKLRYGFIIQNNRTSISNFYLD